MNIGEFLKIKNTSDISIDKLKRISIESEASSNFLFEGIGAIGTLMFESSCNDGDVLNKDVVGKLGLLIQETISVALALDENAFQSSLEYKRRTAPPPPCTLRNRRERKIKLLVLLAISIMLNYHYSNLKVIYTKTNQRKK